MSQYLRVSLGVIILLTISASLSSARDLPSQKADGIQIGQTMPPLPNTKNYTDSSVPPISLWLLETDQVRATISNVGQFGTGFIYDSPCDGEECPSFESPGNSDLEYLFSGAVWIGGIVGDDTLVSVGADGWFPTYELWPDHPIHEFDGVGGNSIWTHFTDTIDDPDYASIDQFDNRPHGPLNLKIANRVHVWNADPENNLIMYDMVITNIGDQVINTGYVGLFFDGDAYHMDNQNQGFQDDIAGSLPDEGIAYILDNDGDPNIDQQFDYKSPTRLFAFKLLSTSFDAADTNFNWWISHGNPALDFGPRLAGTPEDPFRPFNGHIGTPTGDLNKYYILSHREWDYDQCAAAVSHEADGFLPPPDSALAADCANGYDARFLMSIGPFDLEPDSSIRIIYTTFTGDSVIQVVDNLDNLPDNPDQYLANLSFTHVLSNAAAADLIAPTLVDPAYPPTGLSIVYDCFDSVVIEWDPYSFIGVDGYWIYLYKVPQDSMPYPDAFPPWLESIDLSVMVLAAGAGMYYQHTFNTLMPSHFYLTSVANNGTGGVGQLCRPITLRPGGRKPGPIPEDKFVFVEEGGLAAIRWAEPEGIDVDHYNVYKLAERDTIPGLFHPFYSVIDFSGIVAPLDSFYRNDQWYYYYAMVPYAQTDSGNVGIFDYAENNTRYYVTVVDEFSIESNFSDATTVFTIESSALRDILVINCSEGSPRVDRIECDTVTNFYNFILGDSYDRYDMPETLNTYQTYKPDWWRDLIPYRLVIMDGGFENDNMCGSSSFCNTVVDLEKYIQSGGKLAYFGSLPDFSGGLLPPLGYHSVDYHWFIDQYFGIDSVFRIHITYYAMQGGPIDDFLAGVIAAVPAIPETPYITYNPLALALGVFNDFWDENAAPCPSTFVVNAQGQTLYHAESMYPDTSLIDGHPIGVKTSVAGTATYIFGFHLWYMDPEQAVLLVDYLLNDDVSTEFECGDANGDGMVDIGDAVFLINYIFRGGWAPFPEAAGDVNGDLMTDLGDAVYLVNYFFRGGPPPQCR
jgi:hypothetical protein